MSALKAGQKVTIWGPSADGQIEKLPSSVHSLNSKGTRAKVWIPGYEGTDRTDMVWTFFVNKDGDWQQLYSRNTTLLTD